MREGKNGNDRIETPRETGTPEKGSGILPTKVSRRVARALESGTGAVSAAFESALDRVVETGGKYRRLWLVRHFDYEDSEEAREYLEQSKKDKSRMDEGELGALNELGKQVRANVDDPFIQRIIRGSFRKRPDGTKATLYLDAEESIAARNRMTYEWVDGSEGLKNRFVTKRFKITTEKVDDTGEKTFRAFAEIGGIMNDWLAGEDGGDGVIFGNRTPSHAFWLRVWRPCYSEKDHTDQMERLGYDFWDVEKTTGKPVLIQNGKTLRVTLENLGGIEKAVLGACDDADRKKKVSAAFANIPLVMLQEAVNETLAELRESDRSGYEAFLRSVCEWKNEAGKHDPELQSYAFERLVELWASWEELFEAEWSTGALEWMATKSHREFVIRYFWESEDGPMDDLGPFAKSINVKGMKELFADAHEYWKIRQKQKRSVDPAVRDGMEGAIQARTCFLKLGREPVKKENEKWGPHGYADVFKMSRNANVAVFGKTGEGKSIWLTELAKWAISEGKKVIFLEAKNLRPENLEPGGRMRREFENPNALICVDAIDEIRNQDTKLRILKSLNEAWKRCVITSRPSEIDIFSEELTRLELGAINSEKFIVDRIANPDMRRKVLESLGVVGISIWHRASPLMLSFVCMLWGELGSEMKTKTQFMERISRFILTKHAKDGKGQDFTEEDLEEWMRKLGLYAYEKQCGVGQSKRNPTFDAHLALLFKEGEDGKYDFVHASFYEHFLSRHLADSENSAKIIMDWKSSALWKGPQVATLANRHVWRTRLPIIASAMEMVVAAGNADKIREIAHELITDPDDDDIWTGFFFWLEILESSSKALWSCISEYLQAAYSEIGAWNEEELALRLPNLQTFLKRNGYPEIPEIDSHIVPALMELTGRPLKESKAERRKTSFKDEFSKLMSGGGKGKYRQKSGEELEIEFSAALRKHASEWALSSGTWLTLNSEWQRISAMQSVVSSLWTRGSKKEVIAFLNQLKIFEARGFKSDELNDYRLILIQNIASSYDKYRLAGKMEPKDLPTLLQEIGKNNPRCLPMAARDAIGTKNSKIWNLAAFELLAVRFNLNRKIYNSDGWRRTDSNENYIVADYFSEYEQLLGEMGISVSEIDNRYEWRPGPTAIREMTGIEENGTNIQKASGAFSGYEPRQPAKFEGRFPKIIGFRIFSHFNSQNCLINADPNGFLKLVGNSVENYDLAEAFRISQCAYRYYELTYA